MKKQRAIYARVSTIEQAKEGYGIDVQLNKLYGYIDLFSEENDKENWEIVEYIDDGVSAKNLNRKEVKRLIDNVKKGIIKEVYIYKLDRITRSVIDAFNLLNMFLKYNCKLISMVDNIDSQSANGRFLVGILAIIAQWERESVSERTNDGLVAMVSQGRYPIAGTIYGYSKTTENKLVVNQEEFEIVMTIHIKIAEGMAAKELEYYLFETKGIDISAEKIKKIIYDMRYVGKLEYKGTNYDNVVPRMISDSLKKTAVKMAKKKTLYKVSCAYYYGNKVLCADCGDVLEHKSTVKKGDKYYYYYCSHCRKRINQEKLSTSILCSILAYANKIDETYRRDKKFKKLKSLENKMHKVYKSFENNKISYPVYIVTIDQLNKEKENVLSSIELLGNKDYIHWSDLTNKERHSFIGLYLKQIVVDMNMKVVVSIEYAE